jgi:signal transduction histidine kinase
MEKRSSSSAADENALLAMLRFGLARVIQVHSEQVRARHPHIQLNLDLVDDEKLLSEMVTLGLFRIYQEAIANIERHAEAGVVNVRYFPAGEAMVLEIQDDGRGFSIPEDWAKFTRGRTGVMGMKQRIEALGGRLRIQSEPGGGTRIHARVPLEAKEAD